VQYTKSTEIHNLSIAEIDKLQYPPDMAKKQIQTKQDAVLSIRLYSHELNTIKIAAKASNRSVSKWVTDKCMAAAKRTASLEK